MTLELLLADPAYSSWSMRIGLLLDRFDLPVTVRRTTLYCDDFARDLGQFAPARTVPALRLPEGTVIAESLAIAEELASRFPDAQLWPADPHARAVARALAAEMHSGFSALREVCPMNLRVSYAKIPHDAAVERDLARLAGIWDWARRELPSDGPWLCGDYCIADAFFAPVAARIAGYALPVEPSAQAYVDAHLAEPTFRRWRAVSLVSGPHQTFYDRDFPVRDWPGPTPIEATAIDDGTPENATCPYSGRPSTHLMMVSERIFGFCNAVCRDKTVADPEAWPAFMALYAS